MNKNINIPGRLHSVATDGQVAGANEIYDDEQQKFQQEVNTELREEMEDAKEVVGSFDDRVKAIEDLAEISIEGGEVQVANTAEEIVAGSGKVPTANALNERLTSSDYVDDEPVAGSEKLLKSGGVYNELYSGTVTKQFSGSAVNRLLKVPFEINKDSSYIIDMTEAGLSNTDIDNLLYLRTATGSGNNTYVWQYTFTAEDKTEIKNKHKFSVDYNAEYNTSYIHLYFTSDYTPSAGNIITFALKEMKSAFVTRDEYNPSYLKGKVIVCFGDSITEFYGRGREDVEYKRYSDYIEEYTGAECINIGIGGTHLSQRNDPVIVEPGVYHASDYAALDVINIVRAACGMNYNENNSYLELAEIAANQIKLYKETHDDNTAQIARLAAIDWSKVDYVTFLAGTNDWNSGVSLGQTGSNDVTTVLGAINECIRIILSTYKHLKVVWFTPTVRWIGYDTTPASMVPENFSDIYKKNGITLREFSSIIQQEVSLNHIPICDLYNGLGWNMSNFEQYFVIDGTHPFAGFKYLGLFISEFLESGNSTTNLQYIKKLIENKVDKIEGKGLSTNDYTDEEKEVVDCNTFTQSAEYISVETDSEGRILEGIKTDGTKKINTDVELNGDVSITGNKTSTVENVVEYIEAKIDSNNKLIEGVTPEGKKHISQFDNETETVIRGISTSSRVIRIPLLNANFTSPVPVTITGTKGHENAKYEFELPLNPDAYNVRFKFRITENLLNQEKNAKIASINNAQITVQSIPLAQSQSEVEYDGNTYTINWPTTDGGLKFNNGGIDKVYERQHLGQQAFSVKYLGAGTCTIENNGSAILLVVDGVLTQYLFSQYPIVSELYAAMSSNPDIELQFNAIDKRNCNELAIFSSISLRSEFYCDDEGGYNPQNRRMISDSAPFYLRYAVSEEWHQVEIVKIGNKLYSTCDGIVETVSAIGTNNILILGGECGVLFKDLEIYTNSSHDAEVVDYVFRGETQNKFIISEVNPYIVIFEVHGMYDGPAYTVTPASTEDGMSSMNIDTMDYILSTVKEKGYVPVSIKDIANWCVSGGKLPKRCYTLIFDDVRWQVCFDLNIRTVFSRYGAKPSLALITARDTIPIYDGVSITKKDAVDICRAAGWDVVSHTHNHRSTYALKPSQYAEWLYDDIKDADKIGADGSILVFPGGATNQYMGDVMEYVGMKCGIGIPYVSAEPDILIDYKSMNNTLRNRFLLTRVNISRIITAEGTPVDYETQFMNRIY